MAFARPFWVSPRQVLVVPVAAPFVSIILPQLLYVIAQVSNYYVERVCV